MSLRAVAFQRTVYGGAPHAHHGCDLVDGYGLGIIEPTDLDALPRIELRRTTSPTSTRTSSLETRIGAFMNQITLELSQSGEDVEHEHAAGA